MTDAGELGSREPEEELPPRLPPRQTIVYDFYTFFFYKGMLDSEVIKKFPAIQAFMSTHEDYDDYADEYDFAVLRGRERTCPDPDIFEEAERLDADPDAKPRGVALSVVIPKEVFNLVYDTLAAGGWGVKTIKTPSEDENMHVPAEHVLRILGKIAPAS